MRLQLRHALGAFFFQFDFFIKANNQLLQGRRLAVDILNAACGGDEILADLPAR